MNNDLVRQSVRPSAAAGTMSDRKGSGGEKGGGRTERADVFY